MTANPMSEQQLQLATSVRADEWTEDGFDEQTEGGLTADLMYDGMRLMARLLGVTGP